ncbi:MAG: SCP2 sterol-binding domain-containing protein [Bacteroidia bacterium]
MDKPITAKEIVWSLPHRIKKEKAIAEDYNATVHLSLTGEEGGNFTVSVANGECSVAEGLNGEAVCLVNTSDSVYADLEWGRTNPQVAVMFGKVRATNIMALVTFVGMFRTLEKIYKN